MRRAVRRLALAAPPLLVALMLGSIAVADGQTPTAVRAHRTLAPGATLTRHTLDVPGYTEPQKLLAITWPLGDAHYRIRTIFPGRLTEGGTIGAGPDGWITMGLISRWARAWHDPRLVGVISDEPGSVSGDLGFPSGLLIKSRRIQHVFANPTLTAPSIGYTGHGTGMVLGYVRPVPLTFLWPGGRATVASGGATPANDQQVGVTTHTGYRVPAGTRAYALAVTPLAGSYTGSQPVTLPSGAEATAVRFVLRDMQATSTPLTSGISLAGNAGDRISPPAGGALLVARAGGYADLGLATAVVAGSISFNHTAATWASANDVMGGKPLLVVHGTPITTRYWALDDEQWEGQVTRLAIGRTADGRGVMAIMGTSSGSGQGVTAAEFAQSLVQIGVSDALGLNVAHPPELFTPRIASTSCSPYPGWCWRAQPTEFPVPTASALTYTP